MKNLNGILAGKKTYVVSAMGVIGAIASYLAGDIGLSDTIQLVLTATLGATLRSGINTAKK